MKSALRIPAPPSRPLVLYDGDCRFCTFWIRRWQHSTGDSVDYLPFTAAEVKTRWPELSAAQVEAAIHLLEPDGTVYSGAEAVFRVLAKNPRGHWLLDWYAHSTGFARVAEKAYQFVAGHRSFFSALTRFGWGNAIAPSTYQRARWIFLRALGLIYAMAFVSLWVQIGGLLGEHGILPAKLTMLAVRQQVAAAHIGWDRLHLIPTLCWINAGDGFLKAQCAAGTAFAVLLMLDFAPAFCLIFLWVLYLSLSVIGREFLGFQWDALLLETGLLAIFFAPIGGFKWWRLKIRKAEAPPSAISHWLLRWLLFRLLFASGLVKLLSGDPTWRNCTALHYHFETQPLPTWIGWYAHQTPGWFQQSCTAAMFGIELVLPFLIFGPRRFRHIAFTGLVLLQALILLTGNYCFFNLLTLALCVLLLDDAALRSISLIPAASLTLGPHTGAPKFIRALRKTQYLASIPVTCVFIVIPLIMFLQMVHLRAPIPGPVVAFYSWVSPFRSCNSYGLFAVMTTNRSEIIIEGSDDGATWQAYEFKYKPGDPNRRPQFVEPHQPRLDWQMWFAALGRYQDNPWFMNFCGRLLQGSPEVLALLKHNPFPYKSPRYIRAMRYEYHFTSWADRRQTGAWWKREPQGEYLPVISARDQ